MRLAAIRPRECSWSVVNLLDPVSLHGVTALRNATDEERADVVDMLLDVGVDPRKEPYNVRALASGKGEIEAVLKKKRPKR